MTTRKIRWSGPVLLHGSDASDYGVPEGSLFVWAGEADDAGHVEEDVTRILQEHDATGTGFLLTYGPETQAWIDNAVKEMLADLAIDPDPLGRRGHPDDE